MLCCCVYRPEYLPWSPEAAGQQEVQCTHAILTYNHLFLYARTSNSLQAIVTAVIAKAGTTVPIFATMLTCVCCVYVRRVSNDGACTVPYHQVPASLLCG
jgi:hypothetical protein